MRKKKKRKKKAEEERKFEARRVKNWGMFLGEDVEVIEVTFWGEIHTWFLASYSSRNSSGR